MMKNNAVMLLKFLLLSLVIITVGSTANAQMLSLDTCLQIFTADSSTLNKIRIDQDFYTESLSGNGLFVRQFKSKTDKKVSMMKVINTDTTRKQLIYNFRSIEQYALLKNELTTENFQRVDSVKRIIDGKVNINNTYRNGDIWITLRREENSKAPDTKRSLFIRTFGKL